VPGEADTLLAMCSCLYVTELERLSVLSAVLRLLNVQVSYLVLHKAGKLPATCAVSFVICAVVLSAVLLLRR
jgi:hypothetical protein